MTTALTPAPSLAALTNYQTMSLETLLVGLCQFGEPRLNRMKQGWWCIIDMHVAAAGTSFQVKSESDCKTPTSAAIQCTERVIATLKHWTA